MTVTDQSDVHDEIKSRLNLCMFGTVHFSSVQSHAVCKEFNGRLLWTQ